MGGKRPGASAAVFEDDMSQQTAQDEESKDEVECPNCKEVIPGP